MTPTLLSTYRLQYTPDFSFAAAAAVVDYLRDLGVDAVYSSPSLQAVKGSAHSYDVVDPTKVSSDLGGEEAHRELCRAIRAHGLRHILDIVPNHMAIGSYRNKWWWDVLENGRWSRYAAYFDVDWELPGSAENLVLLPILGDHYGRVLERGEVEIERRGQEFFVRYYDHRFPLCPRSFHHLLIPAAERSGATRLAYLAEALSELPKSVEPEALRRRRRDKEVLKELLAELLERDARSAAEIDREIRDINRDRVRLDRLLSEQHYRLAYWRIAREEIGYRRFFDITSLVGLSVEDAEVFEATHSLVLEWLREGRIDGVRVDHIDGLRNPDEYLERLRGRAPDSVIYVEKILMPGEDLPAGWPVQGTTGYDFLNLVNALFVDPAGESVLTGMYRGFCGRTETFAQVAKAKKRVVAERVLAGDINRLTHQLRAVCDRHPRNRDYTWSELREALIALLMNSPVYRSYVRPRAGLVRERDTTIIEQALRAAAGAANPQLLAFIADLLLLRVTGREEAEFVARFQQLSGPLAAKGVEDTALYCYSRLISLNEVGGDPEVCGVLPESFHTDCQRRATAWPQTLLATATHDTKRGEDVRARINVLSEVAEAWAAIVERWAVHNKRHKLHGCPDNEMEYFIYQTLVGAWPLSKERALLYFEKCAREAKEHTSWTAPKADYEQALKHFVGSIFADRHFLDSFEQFLPPIVNAGRINSLAQTLLKLSAPGVPDIYQGTELWSLVLVDPDNRGAVDFARRRELLHRVQTAGVEEIAAGMEEGLPKMLVLHKALQLRRERPEAFAPGAAYTPLAAEGPLSENAIAFMRGDAVIAVVPRLTMRLAQGWRGTALGLPTGRWRNVFTGSVLQGTAQLPDIFGCIPVALLEKQEGR